MFMSLMLEYPFYHIMYIKAGITKGVKSRPRFLEFFNTIKNKELYLITIEYEFLYENRPGRMS